MSCCGSCPIKMNRERRRRHETGSPKHRRASHQTAGLHPIQHLQPRKTGSDQTMLPKHLISMERHGQTPPETTVPRRSTGHRQMEAEMKKYKHWDLTSPLEVPGYIFRLDDSPPKMPMVGKHVNYTATKQIIKDSRKSSKLMDSTESLHSCRKLEEENQELKCENQSLKKELEQMKKLKLEEKNQELNCENQSLKKELEQMKTLKLEEENQKCENQRLKKELERLKTFVNSNITAADISKHTTLIIPGQHNLRDTADKYDRKTRKTLHEFPKQFTVDHSSESVKMACNEVFQVTYDTCKGFILETFKEKLKKLVTMPAGSGLELCLSADEEECYSDLQRSYGFLLSACKMRGTPAPVEKVTELVNQQFRVKHQIELLQVPFLPVIKDSVSVAWDMLTLLPPAVLCTPKKYFEDWHRIVGSLEDRKRYFKLRYYRPLMLSHAHGSAAVKATVRRLASSDPTPNEDSDYEDDGAKVQRLLRSSCDQDNHD